MQLVAGWAYRLELEVVPGGRVCRGACPAASAEAAATEAGEGRVAGEGEGGVERARAEEGACVAAADAAVACVAGSQLELGRFAEGGPAGGVSKGVPSGLRLDVSHAQPLEEGEVWLAEGEGGGWGTTAATATSTTATSAAATAGPTYRLRLRVVVGPRSPQVTHDLLEDGGRVLTYVDLVA